MNLQVEMNQRVYRNPLLIASGCFGFGREAQPWLDLSALGGFCSKGLTLRARLGNPAPRLAEAQAGLLNSVGLQNPGVEAFLAKDLDELLQLDCQLIVNLAGHSVDDYVEALYLFEESPVEVIELNLSCPNVASGCMAIGSDPEQLYQCLTACCKVSSKEIWAKLTPNTASIADCARAAEAAGANALSLVNTFLAMAVDLKSRRPVLRNNTGGLSGPAIKPIALRMVHEAYQAVKIPIVGLGGIASGQDLLEFILCGASLVEIGTCLLREPLAPLRILREAESLANELGLKSLEEFRGSLIHW